jgi:hypothetical protein
MAHSLGNLSHNNNYSIVENCGYNADWSLISRDIANTPGLLLSMQWEDN